MTHAANGAMRDWVSETLEGMARVRAARHPSQAISPDEVGVEIRVGATIHRLSLEAASGVASALAAALDRVRCENPRLMADASLSRSEVDLVSRSVEWMRILLAQGRSLETITDAQIEHSMLLRRLRTGAAPLAFPPPTSHGQPWYQVIEGDDSAVHRVDTDGKLTTLAELLGTGNTSATARNQFLIKINGCHWNVIRTLTFGSSFLVAYPGHAQLFMLAGAKEAGGHSAWFLRKVKKHGAPLAGDMTTLADDVVAR